MLESVPSNKRWLTIMAALAIGLLAVLTLLTVLMRIPVMETDLLQRSRQALMAADLPINLLSFSGRDAVLQGMIASEEQANHMVRILQHIHGVRAVDNQLTPDSASAQVDDLTFNEPLLGGKMENGLFIPQADQLIEKLDLSGIKFEYAQARLATSKETTSALQSIVEELTKQPQLTIEISAHSDGVGTTLGQIALTQARAEAVKAWLVAHNIKPERLVAKGYGASRPLASNTTEEGRIKNRRIAIAVLHR